MRQKRTRLVGAAVTVVLLALTAACGSSASSSSSSSGSTSAAAASDLTEAKRIVDAAETTAVIGPASGFLKPADIQAASASAIKPQPWKAEAGKPGKVITISCASVSPTCERQASLEFGFMQQLGWTGQKVSAGNDYTPQSYQRAMTQAIAEKPDVIITNGITSDAIGPQLADAEAAGIFTIATGPNEASGAGYGQYNPVGFSLSTSVLASKLAVDMGGSGQVFWFNAPAFQFLAVPEGIAFGQQICTGCTFEQQDTTAAVINDPVAFGGLITQTIQANPQVKAIAMPGDTPLVVAKQAISRSNNPDVNVYANAFNASIGSALQDGATPIMLGFPAAWSAIVSVDLALRHQLGQPPLPEAEVTIGSMIMLADQAPEGQLDEAIVDNWSLSHFDYLAPYSEAYGVDLNASL